jgi:starch synthase
MVDDLTVELAHMKEDVIVISPYYERNKRGETGYLEKDGMKHIRNIDIWVDGVKYVFGVHYGVFNMVKLYWLHNPELFPTAYCGDDPKYIMK